MKKLLFAVLLVAFTAGCASGGGGYGSMGYMVIDDCGFRYCYSPYYDATASAPGSPSRSEIVRLERQRVPIIVERDGFHFANTAMGYAEGSSGIVGGSVTVERMAVAPPVSQGEPRTVSTRD